ncbi:MAG TPA: glycosyltransferase family 39 protein [Bryobacteraceae bacterium]|jgi:uncharacterized membrane protein|nr:glycosyltransferase family 39 protein [Bryobacteraceae bacterium]
MLSTGSSSRAARASTLPDSVSDRLEALLFPSAAAAMLVFIFVGIGRSLWLDEANSVSIASGSFFGIFERLKADNNFPVYYVLLHFWVRLFGESEPALRLLSGLAYLAGTITVYWGGRTLFRDKRTGLSAAFCYLVSTQAIRQAQNVRMYTLLGLLSALSTVFFCRIFEKEDDSQRPWMWYVAVNAVGALTHLWFAFVLVGQCAAVIIWRRRRLRAFLAASAASYLPFLVLWSPALYAQLHNGATGWMPRFEPVFVAHAFMDYYGGPYALAFYAACGVLIFYNRGQKPADATLARLLITCFGVSLALPLAISAVKPIFWPGRYTIIGLAPLALWLGAALARSAPRPALAIFCYLTLATVLVAHIWQRDVNSESGLPESNSDKAATGLLLQLGKPGDALVFTSLSRATLDYYLRRAGAQSRFLEIGFPSENSVHLGWGDTKVDDRRLPLLKAEAEDDASRLAGMARGTRVWVLYGASLAVSSILRDALNRRLKFEREIPLTGPYYLQVLEFSH